ncbi:hypothetical protein [Pedobacter nutrimenti]|uniref:Uncharacterized protein n=1 Tax=Pedobacter nutrimenti TaxID=1241337 RepID=A0A318UEL8_9SPHI|nr:hypothetical protein [Pedobacter nutrimenti]PYF74503.1 hypothetical protein B0O44_104675 [Pedobacter nutrimenti]
MITTSTPINNLHHFHQKSEKLNTELFEEFDSSFYENLKQELDTLVKEPSDEVINKILAYAKVK